MTQNYFLKMIQNLRENEEVMLYGELLDISESEGEEVAEYLKKQYEEESLDYPYVAPVYDKKAALWGAKTIYFAAQLLLYRENITQDVAQILKPNEFECTPARILSADLTLRFLPDILNQVKMIESEDPLIDMIESILKIWHYSSISIKDQCEDLNFKEIVEDKCLLQLYCNRVIYFKKVNLAKREELKNVILANLGFYKAEFWNELSLEMRSNA